MVGGSGNGDGKNNPRADRSGGAEKLDGAADPGGARTAADRDTRKPAVRVCVVTGYGINTDPELAYAFRQAGADSADRVHVSDLIAGEKVVGWFQGRMEFGPRALGARSILGDPRSREMQSVINLKIKFRESFRPFAPTILAEHVSEYFELDRESPYMLLVAPVRAERLKELTDEEKEAQGFAKLKVIRSDVPAITHVDNSARIQTVQRADNPVYYRLIERFYEKTGCPVIINTSFNVRGEPIVCAPQEAFTCFMRTNMDYLVLGSFVLDKTKQKPWKDTDNWKQEFELD